MQRIKKGDTVEVIAGQDLGQQGQVLEVFPKDRPGRRGAGQCRQEASASRPGRAAANTGRDHRDWKPLHLSNVMLVCTQCKQKTRVGFRINEEGRKVRVCKHCKQDID